MENIIRNNPYYTNLRNNPQPKVIQPETPDTTYGDLEALLNELNQTSQEAQNSSNRGSNTYVEQSNNTSTGQTNWSVDDLMRKRELKSEVNKQVQSSQGEQQKPKGFWDRVNDVKNWTTETVKNTGNRAKELTTGLIAAAQNPGEYIGKPLGRYVADKQFAFEDAKERGDIAGMILPFAEVLRDTGDFVYKPLTGQSSSDIISQPVQDTLKGIKDHIHNGGTLDAYLTLVGTPAGKVINKGIAKGVKGTLKGTEKVLTKVDDAVTGGKLVRPAIEKAEDFIKTSQAEKSLRAETAIAKAEAKKPLQEFKQELLEAQKKTKMKDSELEEIIEHMQGTEGKDLSMLREELIPKYEAIKPVVKKYDDIMQKYATAEPGNIQEIVQALRERGSQGGLGDGLSYQAVKEMLEESGLLNFGKFVDKETGKLVKPDNYRRALEGQGTTATEKAVYDLRNTKFVIPQENLDRLATLALDYQNPERAIMAKALFDTYGLAEGGYLQRISHGLAPVDKTVKLGKAGKAIKNRENYLATERVFGSAKAEDIAAQWLEPDNLFQHAIRNVVKENLTQAFKEEFARTGQPIMNKLARPEDIRYVTPEMLNSIGQAKDLEKFALKEIPTGANPSDYIGIDKYTLNAYKNLFTPKSNQAIMKAAPWLKDLTTLFKQQLLASGLYLGGNLLGGLHNMLTHSNLSLYKDLADAIKTHGALSKELGTYREMPIAGDVRMATNRNTAIGKTVRGMNTINQPITHPMQLADAKMQNLFAEVAAHNVMRKLGVKFENRNLEWMKDNLTKQQVYEAMSDIEKMAFIYGEETLIPKTVLDFMALGNPFVRWVDQATQSSIHAIRKNPGMYGYLQGAVLGRLAWDQNEANAHGLNISNPQSGKIYKVDPRTGAPKVVESEMIPIMTSINTVADIPKFLTKNGSIATLQWASNLIKANDEYGRIKERKEWKGLLPDYRRKVRTKDGYVQQFVEGDEYLTQLFQNSVYGQAANKTLLPLMYGATGKQSYLPYNDTFLNSTQGNPDKLYGPYQVVNRLLTNYEHGLIPGIDIPYTEKQQTQLQKQANKKQAKGEAERENVQDVLDRERNKYFR